MATNKLKAKIKKGHAVNQPKKKMTAKHKAAGRKYMAGGKVGVTHTIKSNMKKKKSPMKKIANSGKPSGMKKMGTKKTGMFRSRKK